MQGWEYFLQELIMRRKNKQTKTIAVLLMLSLVITWLSLLYVFYSMGTPLSQKIFSLLLLTSPVIIIVVDRPTIFMDFANALLDTISIILMKVIELIEKYIREKNINTKFNKRKIERREKISKY